MLEIYASIDIEADGPIPGPHSMLSPASAAFLTDKTMVGTYSANLNTLPEAGATPRRWPGGPSNSTPGTPAGSIREIRRRMTSCWFIYILVVCW